ncbi:MAG: hypothetical protein HYZ85_00005, partial [Candidatus Omnitrophica bacterium]|nr:hypothetical protein [Candidatus Omnitrophota bacterium]
ITHTSTLDVKTALFKRGSVYYLVVVNNGNEDKSANIEMPVLKQVGRKMKIRDLMSREKKSTVFETQRLFTVDIPRKDGKVFEFRPI